MSVADHIDADERHDLDTTSLAQEKGVRVSSFGTPPGGADNKVVLVNENTTEVTVTASINPAGRSQGLPRHVVPIKA